MLRFMSSDSGTVIETIHFRWLYLSINSTLVVNSQLLILHDGHSKCVYTKCCSNCRCYHEEMKYSFHICKIYATIKEFT